MVKYYEFDKHEYYALIKASDVKEAFKLYVDLVAGDSIELVENEGAPSEVESFEAFIKFTNAYTESGGILTAKEAIDEFSDPYNEVLLIDGSLL